MKVGIHSLKLVAALGAAIFCLTATGCATLVRGDTQSINIRSEPSGATVTVEGQSYTTPAIVKMKRTQEYLVTVTKEGYQTVTFNMKAQWDGASLPGAALPGGSIMVATDRGTGADLAFYQPPPVQLTPAPTGTPPREMVLHRGKLYTKDQFEKLMKEEEEEAFRNRAN